MKRVWLIGVVTGCSALSPTALIKSPVTDQCVAANLKGCPDLVDGVLLYVDGDKSGGQAKIRLAAGTNSPESMRAFSQKLRDVSSLPGAGDLAKPLNEIAAMLISGPSASSGGQPGDSVSPDNQPAAATAPVALPASADFERLRTDSVLLATQATQPCKLGTLNALCAGRRFRGPLVVTDAIVGRGCTDQLFIGAQEAEKQDLRWLVDASHPGIHGAAFVVRPGDLLFFATVPESAQPANDPRCMLTWAAYRPRTADDDD